MSARVGRFENRAIGCTRLWRVLNEIVAPNLPRICYLPGHRPGVGPDMTVTSSVSTAPTSTELSIKQYSRRKVLAVWVAAALPMAALAWLVAPALAGPAPARRFTQVLIVALCAGLVLQFLLLVILVTWERSGLRWPILHDALWLRPPSTASRRGGLLWLWGVLP